MKSFSLGSLRSLIVAVALALSVAGAAIAQNVRSGSLVSMSVSTAGLGFTNATSGTITVATPTGALGTPTLTLPVTAGGLSTQLYCGSTGVGNQTCSATAAAGTTKVYAGHSTLASNAAIITFPTAFASTTYDCVANDITTRANPVQMLSTSSSTATITNTTGASDVINWVCVGQ